jgi:hypothetical protein
MTLFYAAGAVSTTSDPEGNFTLENVPPGIGHVSIKEAGVIICQSPVEVPPGGTAQVQIGGVGLPVSGRLAAPPGVEVRSWTNQVQFAQLSSESDPLPVPDGITGETYERWRQEWWETEAGQAWSRQRHAYDIQVQPNGSFVLPEVLPGDYRLIIHVREGVLGSGIGAAPSSSNRQIAWAGQKVLVPEPSDAVAVDLGDIVLTPTK